MMNLLVEDLKSLYYVAIFFNLDVAKGFVTWCRDRLLMWSSYAEKCTESGFSSSLSVCIEIILLCF